MPLFWEAEASLRFCNIEAQFNAANVDSQHTKYEAVVRALNREHLKRVDAVIRDKPIVNPYDRLKEALVEAYSVSVKERLASLLNREVVSDGKPSLMLLEMRRLAGDKLARDESFEPLLKVIPESFTCAGASIVVR